MATITTSIGTRSAENVDISSVSGTGPYTVTLASAPTTTNIGDTLTDEAVTPNSYLITGISGSDLTVTDSFGAGTAPSAAGSSQATTIRSYSSITNWEADLDDTGLYTAADDAVGECYNDSAFDEDVDVNGGGTIGLTSTTLSVASGERHDGTAGTGARIVRTGSTINTPTLNANRNPTYIEWIEIDANGQGSGQNFKIGEVGCYGRNLVCHGNNIISAQFGKFMHCAINSHTKFGVLNCICYDFTNTTDFQTDGMFGNQFGVEVLNCTFYGIACTGASANARGLASGGANSNRWQNNVVGGVTANGTAVDYDSNGAGTNDHNASEDGTQSGTGSIQVTISNEFVSTTGGSEDLHLKSGADCIDAGTDLVATPAGVNIDINGSNRDAFTATTWDIGAHQFNLTASIGTTSRDYSTITAWEADLDDTTIYGGGANAVGECYNDSAFDEDIRVDGGTTIGLSHITLTVPIGERHDGTAGTGARIVRSGPGVTSTIDLANTNIDKDFEWLEVDGNGQQINSGRSQFNGFHTGSIFAISNVLGHDIKANIVGAPGIVFVRFFGKAGTHCKNSIFYDADQVFTGAGGSIAGLARSGGDGKFYNVTVHDIVTASSNGNADCVLGADVSGFAAQNVIATDPSVSGGSGTASCFNPSSYITAVVDHNLSSDATASGTGSLTNKAAANQFVSTTGGSEDLHLKSGADAINAGTDLGTTPTGVNIDIDGRDRDAEGDIWDMGADEFVSIGSLVHRLAGEGGGIAGKGGLAGIHGGLAG